MKEKLYKSIIKQIPYGYACYKIIQQNEKNRTDYEFVEANIAFEKLTRLNAEEIIGKTISSVLPNIAKTDSNWIDFYQNFSLNIANKELKLYSKQSHRWYKILIDTPEKGYLSTMFIDITDTINCQETKNKLTNQLKTLNTIFKNAPYIHFVVNSKGQVKNINNKGIKFSGKEKKDLLGLLAGHAFNCLNSFNGVSCGKSKACSICPIRTRFEATLKTKKSHFEEEGQLTFVINGKETTVNLMISTTFVEIEDQDMVMISISDITKLKQAEKALQTSEQKHNDLLQSINDQMSLIDVNFNILWANEITMKMFGNDIIGKKCYNVFINSNNPCNGGNCFLMKTLKDESVYEHEKTIKGKDGQPLYFHCTTSVAMRDKDGKPTGAMGISRDITSMKLAEKINKSQKLRLENIIKSTHLGTWEWNIQTGQSIFNETWAEIIGYTLEEISPMSVGTWLKYSHPEDQKGSNEILEKHLTGEEEFYSIECRMKHKNGHWIWVLAKGKVISWTQDGKPLWMFGTHQVITNRKQDEENLIALNEKLKATTNALKQNNYELEKAIEISEKNKANVTSIIENTTDSIWAINTNHEIIYLNHVLKSDFNQSFGVELEIGMNPLHALPEQLKPIWKDRYNRALNNEQLVFEDKVEVAPQTYIYIQVRINPIISEGKVIGVSLFASNITKRKLIEEELIALNIELKTASNALQQSNTELEEAKERAEESDQLKSAFLANMSHEIRTPMNAIIGFSSFLSDESNTKETIQKYANIISNSSEHLLNLINDIIDISKIDAGQVSINPEATDINDLLNEQYTFFQSKLLAEERYEIQLFIRTNENELFIETDKTRLRQIFINLIGNAIKFTNNGYIEFGYHIKEKEILFYVKDTGIGIPPNKQNIIFDRFRQATTSTEKLYGGTGLGLAIAKACTEILEGKIWLQSIPDIGTTFYFTIPNKPVEKPQQEQKTEKVKINFKGEHILIAEDDNINYDYLCEALSRYDLKITRALTGKEAIEKIFSDDSIKLILMDIQMPEINGWEATKQIRKQKPNLPIIAQTAYAFADDKNKSLDAGCNDYIAKPTKPKELIELIYTYLK